MRRAYQILFFLHLIVGIAGLMWGISSIFNPVGPLMGMDIEVLENTDLENFLIPSIIIFFFLGKGNLFSMARLAFNFLPGVTINYRSQGLVSVLLSLVLIYFLYQRYTLTLKPDLFMITFTTIATVKLIIAVLMAIYIFLYPARLLHRVLKNSDYYK